MGDAPQTAGQFTFLERVHLVEGPAFGEGVDEVTGKKCTANPPCS